ncbi:hypothetical protein [Sediminicurvatus halobius]|uniref:Uncharacterized protein n=1 Tax=Sediminicurvatus halobius TaxID=2182432 RepID=A0A2U2N144_9GAMM|nr:hypothetical protein [Spiribacter halobius]PWG62840.1 hypothetical protein DEM34_10765 [Spiribacter halobius]UEX77010.1 hypothetical protein LMH63_13790 [Spiribacter halobius]
MSAPVTLTAPQGRRERVLGWLGIVPASRALRSGYTHHARIYGLVPCWFAFEEPEGAAVCTKWRPLTLLDCVLDWIWFLAWVSVHGEDEPPLWGFKVGRRIDA